MSFKKFFKDKIVLITVEIILSVYMILILKIAQVNSSVISVLIGINIIFKAIIFIISYHKRKMFYNNVKDKVQKLDKKYLISEVINKPTFYEGEIFYDISKSMINSIIEEINKYKINSLEYKEYIEIFVHEVKTPLLGIKLIIENNKNEVTKRIEDELYKIENFLEEIIMYTKIEHLSTDYSLKNYILEEIVNESLKKNASLLIENKVKIIKENLLSEIVTDKNWIQFVITQIISNSVKYMECNKTIKFYSKEENNNIILNIEDNGIGIEKHDIDRVFAKGFIGENGRIKGQATGIGLYICKKISVGLGIEIGITSEKGKGTIIKLTFPNITKS